MLVYFSASPPLGRSGFIEYFIFCETKNECEKAKDKRSTLKNKEKRLQNEKIKNLNASTVKTDNCKDR
jgi:hypothetical protein